MKRLLPFLLIFFPVCLLAQDRSVLFKLRQPINDSLPVVLIDFKNENLSSDFILQGKTQLHYAVEMKNYDYITLYKIENEKVKIETLKYPVRSQFSSDTIFSGLRITDFNKDGNEDLLCLTHSNYMTGVIIYLNDPSQQKLIKLYNTAESSYFWVNPVFDESNNMIKCHYEDNEHGDFFESTYTLKDFTATAISKHHKGYVKDKEFDNRYEVQNNKWVIVK